MYIKQRLNNNPNTICFGRTINCTYMPVKMAIPSTTFKYITKHFNKFFIIYSRTFVQNI